MTSTRRTVLTSVAALGAALTVPVGNAAATPAGSVPFRLPTPVGPYRIGTVPLHLTDSSRPEPWVPSRPCRELMITVWYPAGPRVPARSHPRAPWMPPGEASRCLARSGLGPDAVDFGRTHGHLRAPAAAAPAEGRPVVLYSPGSNASRAFGTTIAEDLVSHGYIVVTVDHTYDAIAVEFPGGRVESHPDGEIRDYAKALAVRTADIRFVLDRLDDLHAASTDPRLPPGLCEALDLRRVGMVGHSLGGATTAGALHSDPRITAGVSLDGGAAGPVVHAGLDRPFLIVDTPGKGGFAHNPALRELWSRLRGWRMRLTVTGAAHQSFGDDALLLRLIAPLLGWTRQELEDQVGTLPLHRAQAFQRGWPRAFFDLHFHGRDGLVEQLPHHFPEVLVSR
ncbi:alpha/beta hydrolase family protein [Streptomyces sp. NPDC058953]|uniref:alpha/beta hydrolase family protein n=1 Tax=unclassified Streptomyces TaxID=2593676 RepID=UPI0036A99F83